MKLSVLFLFLLCVCFTGPALKPVDHVEFVCMKKNMASKTCHYNFTIDGARYRYVDIGCKFKKTEKVIEKAQTGELALARDWKIACPDSKEANP